MTITKLDAAYFGDVAPKKVLKGARGAKLSEVLVLGLDADGEFYGASSTADIPKLLLLLELGKRGVLKTVDD